MDSFVIPAGIEDARVRLATLESIARATGWERAAIVWAFVDRPGQGARTDTSAELPKLSPDKFAALGIAGLRSHHTVAHYHWAWQAAIDDGVAQPVEPGDTVTLPDATFPPNPTVGRNIKDPADRDALVAQAESDGVGASKVIDVASNPKAIAAAIKASPAVAAVAQEAILDQMETQFNVPTRTREPMPVTDSPRPRSVWNALAAVREARKACDFAVRVVTDEAPFTADVIEAIDATAQRIRVASDYLASAAHANGPMTNDAVLAAWLEGDTP